MSEWSSARGGATFQCKLEMWGWEPTSGLFSPPHAIPSGSAYSHSPTPPLIISHLIWNICLNNLVLFRRRAETSGSEKGWQEVNVNEKWSDCIGSSFTPFPHLPTFLQMAIRYYYYSSGGFVIISSAQIPITWLEESAHFFVMAQDYVVRI